MNVPFVDQTISVKSFRHCAHCRGEKFSNILVHVFARRHLMITLTVNIMAMIEYWYTICGIPFVFLPYFNTWSGPCIQGKVWYFFTIFISHNHNFFPFAGGIIFAFKKHWHGILAKVCSSEIKKNWQRFCKKRGPCGGTIRILYPGYPGWPTILSQCTDLAIPNEINPVTTTPHKHIHVSITINVYKRWCGILTDVYVV